MNFENQKESLLKTVNFKNEHKDFEFDKDRHEPFYKEYAIVDSLNDLSVTLDVDRQQITSVKELVDHMHQWLEEHKFPKRQQVILYGQVAPNKFVWKTNYAFRNTFILNNIDGFQ